MKDRALRALCLLACLPGIGALLARVWEVCPMQPVALYLGLPGAVCLLLAWRRGGRLGEDLSLGFWGGLVGTLAYDLARVPFALAGMKVFAPIGAYGVWLAEADASSGLTTSLGWGYHFANGVCFGWMYSLCMRGRGWGWAVLWGMLLETLAVLSPFGNLFAIRGNPTGLAVAYAGHVAFGIPLGLIVQHPDPVLEWLRQVPGSFKVYLLGVFALAVLSPALRGGPSPEGMVVEGDRLSPEWVRRAPGTGVRVVNPGSTYRRLELEGADYPLPAGGEVTVRSQTRGIHPLRLETGSKVRISFLLVE